MREPSLHLRHKGMECNDFMPLLGEVIGKNKSKETISYARATKDCNFHKYLLITIYYIITRLETNEN